MQTAGRSNVTKPELSNPRLQRTWSSLTLDTTPLNGRSLDSRRDFQVAADLEGQEILDLGVTGHRRDLTVGPIHEDRMPATFAKQFAAVRLKVSNELAALQPVASLSGSRMR